MKFITVRDLRNKPSEIWNELKILSEIIITNHGRPIAMLTPISENNLEEELKVIRKSRAIMAFRNMQKKSRANGLEKLSMDEIQKEIKRSRKSKKA